MKRKSFKITIDLMDQNLYELLKLEAVRQHSMKQVIHNALKLYFEDRLETFTLAEAAKKAFSEWENPLDSDYDKL
ncbi:MAG: hypothetical protein A3D19_06375 [Deltaproteobacteria bacterium RIFCSPHIGHO2_02_FULL_38_15]|nr:MAG: hypothetical protein A3D19_06375 [Deltaproteobacteria bacterium RIFCSPHIGHO2_02_FULL_38_15]HBQ21689.1 hypothetical protein [Deltaproteobacteria bacterium]